MSSQKGNKGKRKKAIANVLADVLGPSEILDLLGAIGTEQIQLLCDGRTEAEKSALTDEQKRQLRQEAAEQIRQIPTLMAEAVYLKGERISLAEAYRRVLMGEGVSSLQYAIKTLVAVLKDQRVPQKYKGERGTKGGSYAVRLAIESALDAQAEEFDRNLQKVPGLIEAFNRALQKGDHEKMEGLINYLARPYFKGPLVEHHDCGKEANLRPWFDSLQMQVDAVKDANQ